MAALFEPHFEVVYHGHMQLFEFFRKALGVGILSLLLTSAHAAELLMIEQPSCPYCEQFHREIGPAYPKTDEGKTAPLRVLMLQDPYPDELKSLAPATVTPTFILVNDNKEVDRLVGYPGDEHFWFLLGEMLEKLHP